MKWIDGKDVDIRSLSGEELCERLSLELWDADRSQWLECNDFIQTAAFLIDFDSELAMEGIFTFLENSIGHYTPDIIKAFEAIGDENDAEVLSEICRLAPPDFMRGEFLSDNHQEYEISIFNNGHELSEEVLDRIEELENQLYLNTGFDMWKLLYKYLDEQIEKL
ncbi:MAG: DMP19 family protein [Oscillospiraceae bacterium]|nr:DMP19 family protein [Oscillospiraceae bacterium]